MHRSLATRVLKGIYWFILKALYRFRQAWKLRLSLVQRAFYMRMLSCPVIDLMLTGKEDRMRKAVIIKMYMIFSTVKCISRHNFQTADLAAIYVVVVYYNRGALTFLILLLFLNVKISLRRGYFLSCFCRVSAVLFWIFT